jgi:hypothetical protein
MDEGCASSSRWLRNTGGPPAQPTINNAKTRIELRIASFLIH